VRRNQRTFALPPPAARTSLRFIRPLPLTRQDAKAFNQTLSSFDTSEVTDMSGMFNVRSARDLAPPSLDRTLLPVHTGLPAPQPTHMHTLPPPSPHLAPHRTPSL